MKKQTAPGKQSIDQLAISRQDITESKAFKRKDKRARDTTKCKSTCHDLELSEKRFRNLVETTADWVWETDQKGKYTYAGPQIQNLLGYKPAEVIGKTPFDFMPPDELKHISKVFKSISARRIPFNNLENVNRHKDGRLVVLETSGVPFFDSHGHFRGYRGIDRDITERKLFEKTLKTSLREKEILLRELYHRTKNNMQVISNLIDLQAAYVSDERTLESFREIQNRIRAMALVQEKLCQSMHLSNVDLKDYVRDLARVLLESYHLDFNRIALKLDLNSISVSIDTATPCGLIVNELMSNSLKHAFPDNRRGEISIALHRTKKGEIELVFSDNGVGLPKGFDFSNVRSLGLNLVKSLAEKQLNGIVDLGTGHLTEFLVRFEEPVYLKRV
jgi:PAS domain S-box-containing protein